MCRCGAPWAHTRADRTAPRQPASTVQAASHVRGWSHRLMGRRCCACWAQLARHTKTSRRPYMGCGCLMRSAVLLSPRSRSSAPHLRAHERQSYQQTRMHRPGRGRRGPGEPRPSHSAARPVCDQLAPVRAWRRWARPCWRAASGTTRAPTCTTRTWRALACRTRTCAATDCSSAAGAAFYGWHAPHRASPSGLAATHHAPACLNPAQVAAKCALRSATGGHRHVRPPASQLHGAGAGAGGARAGGRRRARSPRAPPPFVHPWAVCPQLPPSGTRGDRA